MRHAHAKGFTLIEVIIALFILSFLSLFTVQAIQKALQSKAKIQKDIDKNSTLRDALRVMERDVNLAFNYRDAYTMLYNQAQDSRRQLALQGSGPGQGSGTTPSGTTSAGGPGGFTPQPATNPALPRQIDETKYKKKLEDKVKTQFIGESESMNFTSLSNVRMMENQPISSQAEIGYHLKPCRRRSDQEQSSKCLWRRVSNYLHEDITKEGDETVLLENVMEFKLRYLGPGKEDEWIESWMSNERGDDQTKGKFPYAVEITIAVKDPKPDAKDKVLRMTTVAAIRNPNNLTKEQQDQLQQQQQQNQPNNGQVLPPVSPNPSPRQ